MTGGRGVKVPWEVDGANPRNWAGSRKGYWRTAGSLRAVIEAPTMEFVQSAECPTNVARSGRVLAMTSTEPIALSW
jgi:hypothetical protein